MEKGQIEKIGDVKTLISYYKKIHKEKGNGCLSDWSLKNQIFL